MSDAQPRKNNLVPLMRFLLLFSHLLILLIKLLLEVTTCRQASIGIFKANKSRMKQENRNWESSVLSDYS